MKTCRHLAAFKIDVTVIDPSQSGLPPWMALCSNCSYEAVKAIRHRIADIKASRLGRGKLALAHKGHLESLLKELGVSVEKEEMFAAGDGGFLSGITEPTKGD